MGHIVLNTTLLLQGFFQSACPRNMIYLIAKISSPE